MAREGLLNLGYTPVEAERAARPRRGRDRRGARSSPRCEAPPEPRPHERRTWTRHSNAGSGAGPAPRRKAHRPSPTRAEEIGRYVDDDFDRTLAAPDPRGLRQPGPGHRAARDLHRGGAPPRGGARPRAARRPAGARQDLARPHHRRRALGAPGADRRAGARAQGRHRRLPDRARARQRLLHRRDPPPRPRRRGDALPGDGGPPPAGRARPGGRGADRDARPAALHADRRDHAHRPADDAASRPLRRLPPPRALRRRRPEADRPALGRDPRCRHRRRGRRRRSPRAPAGRRASPTGCCAASATSPRSAARGEISTGVAAEALEMLEVDPSGSTATTASCSR